MYYITRLVSSTYNLRQRTLTTDKERKKHTQAVGLKPFPYYKNMLRARHCDLDKIARWLFSLFPTLFIC